MVIPLFLSQAHISVTDSPTDGIAEVDDLTDADKTGDSEELVGVPAR